MHWLQMYTTQLDLRYMEHLRKRAAGEVMTTAAWLRHFVTTHPEYKKDSRVTDEIAYDLVVACQEIGLVSYRAFCRLASTNQSVTGLSEADSEGEYSSWKYISSREPILEEAI